jgi:hypothetical protein
MAGSPVPLAAIDTKHLLPEFFAGYFRLETICSPCCTGATDRFRIAEGDGGRRFALHRIRMTVKWRAVQPKATAMR